MVSDEQKKSTGALLGILPTTIPVAINARVLGDLVYGPVIHSFYHGHYEKGRADNPQLTDKEFDQSWDERYDHHGYEIPWNLLPENQCHGSRPPWTRAHRTEPASRSAPADAPSAIRREVPRCPFPAARSCSAFPAPMSGTPRPR
jgi:hypothetical protein